MNMVKGMTNRAAMCGLMVRVKENYSELSYQNDDDDAGSRSGQDKS